MVIHIIQQITKWNDKTGDECEGESPKLAKECFNWNP